MSDTWIPQGDPTADLPYREGLPLSRGCLRAVAEHFQVEEQLGFEPAGRGEHFLVLVEKVDANTEWVARQFVKRFGIRPLDVGYAGLKDRHARVRQWLSIRFPGKVEPPWETLDIPGVTVVAIHRHDRKLRIGALKSNRFKITVSDFAAQPADLAARIEQVTTRGVPNYFGAQRFGIEGQNLVSACAMLEGRGEQPDRHRRGLYFSAFRSYLFNLVLAERVRLGLWDTLIPGDVAMFTGSNSMFAVAEVTEELRARCQSFELHPSGPLCGKGFGKVSGDALALEARVVGNYQPWVDALIKAGLEGGRRQLRLPVSDFQAVSGDRELTLGFTLPSGAFATVVLRELLRAESASQDIVSDG